MDVCVMAISPSVAAAGVKRWSARQEQRIVTACGSVGIRRFIKQYHPCFEHHSHHHKNHYPSSQNAHDHMNQTALGKRNRTEAHEPFSRHCDRITNTK